MDFWYYFRILRKHGLEVEAHMCVRHHRVDNFYQSNVGIPSIPFGDLPVVATAYASVGRIAEAKKPFWNIVPQYRIGRMSIELGWERLLLPRIRSGARIEGTSVRHLSETQLAPRSRCRTSTSE